MLADIQREFMALILDDARPAPAGWNSGRLAIYRNAYRARIVEALRDSYPRTGRWVGEDAFRRAAVHHVIQYPPASWTLDAVGEGFCTTLGELFSNDPDVRELAWLEWAMHRCYLSADEGPLDVAGFEAATAGCRDDDWAQLRLTFVAGTQVQPVRYRVDTLWRALAEAAPRPDAALAERTPEGASTCVVWRQGLTPVFTLVDALEGQALAMLLRGETYGEVCAALAREVSDTAAVSEAGAMLGRWIVEGMITAVATGPRVNFPTLPPPTASRR